MKRNHFILVLLGITLGLLLQGCAHQDRSQELKQLVMKFQQAYDSHDAAALAQLYTEDAVYVVSGEPEPLRGRKAIEGNCVVFFRAFPDLTVKFTNIFTSGDQFCTEFIVNGTHTGPLASPEGDIPPTGRSVQFRGAFFGKVTPEGLVAEDRTYYDTASFMNQLGLGEKPEEMSNK